MSSSRSAHPMAVLRSAWGSRVARAQGSDLNFYSWNDFVATLNAQGHDLQVTRVPPEAYDSFYPGAREMYQYYEQHTYFGPEGRSASPLPTPWSPAGSRVSPTGRRST